MKLFVSWTMAVTLLLLVAPAVADDTAAGRAANNKASSESVMSLIPGIYIAGGGGENPNAFAVRISQVSGNAFKGSLELIRLDKSGDLVRETSELEGVLGKQQITETFFPYHYENTGVAPLVIKLANGSLQARMAGLEGNMTSLGFRLSWTLPRNETGSSYGNFVLSNETAYGEILARYSEMSSFKKLLRAGETASANLVAAKLNDYIKDADKWLGAAHRDDLEFIGSGVRALYVKESKLVRDNALDKAAASVILIQIEAYESQAIYISRAQYEQERFQRGSWFSLEQVLQDSFCTEGTSTQLGRNVSSSCDVLPKLFLAAEQRWNRVRGVQIEMARRRNCVLEEIACLKEAAMVPFEPNRRTSPSCGKFMAQQM